jgi:energy-converting hydrogenase Eha subunit H
MRSPSNSTLLAVALTLLVLGVISIATCVGQGRLFLAPDAMMWRVNWPSYVCLIAASLLLLFTLVRAIFRSLHS